MTLALSLTMAQRNWQVALAHLSISEGPEVGEERTEGSIISTSDGCPVYSCQKPCGLGGPVAVS